MHTRRVFIICYIVFLLCNTHFSERWLFPSESPESVSRRGCSITYKYFCLFLLSMLWCLHNHNTDTQPMKWTLWGSGAMARQTGVLAALSEIIPHGFSLPRRCQDMSGWHLALSHAFNPFSSSLPPPSAAVPSHRCDVFSAVHAFWGKHIRVLCSQITQ